MCVTPGSSSAFWTSSPTSRPLPCCSACRPKPALSTANHLVVIDDPLVRPEPPGLILVRQQQRGSLTTAVVVFGLGDDPHLRPAVPEDVSREKPAPVRHRLVIGR